MRSMFRMFRREFQRARSEFPCGCVVMDYPDVSTVDGSACEVGHGNVGAPLLEDI